MDYIKEYRSFIYSHYLSEGVRMTAGIVLPALLLNYFNLLPVGVVVSLGAMSISITDNPGPIHHRKNGMLTCIVINTVMALLTGIVASQSILLGILLTISCFVFSMIAVFGVRATSIGLSALLILVLNIDRHHEGWDILLNAAYITAGGVWYMLLSLALYGFRPYKLAQQALGDCIMATADYLRIRATFYEARDDYDDTYEKMLAQQITVHEKQNLVRELLFKSRRVVKESTITGRTLVMMFTEIVDLFERTMSTYNDYSAMHKAFGNDGILDRFRQVIVDMSDALDVIGIDVKSGDRSKEPVELISHINDLKKAFGKFRDQKRNAGNLDEFINLRHILNSIEDIAGRIRTLQLYTGYDRTLASSNPAKVDFEQFISHQQIDAELLKDNFSIESNTFRHAIRISIATLVGYIASLFFSVGHSYWILLTIILILKPAYSLTKKRNVQRLSGTIFGALAGFVVLYFIEDGQVLFFIMLVLMILTYSLIKTNYMVAVIFMTAYILVMFHLLNNSDFKTIFLDRVVDTAIGSVIAYLANLLLLPAWEQDTISTYMLKAIQGNRQYFINVSAAFRGKPVSITQYKVSRKNAFVALANLSDAFNRMLAEPKDRQKNSKAMHQFVVLNHMLTSHIATLASYVLSMSEKFASSDFAPVIQYAVARLEEAERIIGDVPTKEPEPEAPYHNKLQQRLKILLDRRRHELEQGIEESDIKVKLSELKPLADQFNFIENIAGDIKKAGLAWKED